MVPSSPAFPFPSVTCAVLLLLAAGPARTQAFNVDYGSANPAPTEGYGAAAGQPGTWNVISGLEERLVPLVTIDGQPSAVTIEPDLPFGPAAFDNPGTVGDDDALLDDYLDLHSVPAAFHLHGLQPGAYVVLTYAWAPDEAAFKTSVTVNGGDTQLVGGKWPGGLRLGITHARHLVGIAEGETLDIQTFGLGKGTLNGLQVVPVDSAFTDLGGGLEGEAGVPEFFGAGDLLAGTAVQLTLARATARAPVTLVAGATLVGMPFKGGVLAPAADVVVPIGTTDDAGELVVTGTSPTGLPPRTAIYLQCWLPDASGPQGLAASNALKALAP